MVDCPKAPKTDLSFAGFEQVKNPALPGGAFRAPGMMRSSEVEVLCGPWRSEPRV